MCRLTSIEGEQRSYSFHLPKIVKNDVFIIIFCFYVAIELVFSIVGAGEHYCSSNVKSVRLVTKSVHRLMYRFNDRIKFVSALLNRLNEQQKQSLQARELFFQSRAR